MVALKKLLLRAVGIATVVVQYGCIAHCTLEFVGDFVVCSGPSMLPTIRPNDVIITDHMTVASGNIARGDVVIARSPVNPTRFVCKRVTALEGDKIIDPHPHYYRTYVPRGHVWLEGDNAHNSTDSRSYGPVPYALIRSKVAYRIWPLHTAGAVGR